MPTKAIEIFQAGSHTSSAGDVLRFSELDLRVTAAAYNRRTTPDAALVVGHPLDESRAENGGYVRGLVAAGMSLYAVANVATNFLEKVRAGELTSVSASFIAPDSAINPAPGAWWLRSVGFLRPHERPALKGLEALDFSEAPNFGPAAHGVAFVSTIEALRSVPGLDFNERVSLARAFDLRERLGR